ncbi:MAG: VanW family protein [Firmicutes bacterium]|nr:VanW family protein [Bacillota bacterium]
MKKIIFAFIIILALAISSIWFFKLWSDSREYDIAAFTTSLSGRSFRQIHNIKLAASKLDGYTIDTGQIFSLQKALGDITKESGFHEAPSIVGGKVVDSTGGGLCQVSSTIYNASLLAGLEIIERHPHLFTVRSVGPGRDAAFANGSCDLKFKNNYSTAVKLRVYITGERLIAKITSFIKTDSKAEVNCEILQTYEPSEKEAANSSGGINGCRVRVFRTIYSDGKEPVTEKISEDTYRPVSPKGFILQGQ